MNKKKNILTLLFLFTIVLIVVMKLILQNEADQWRQNQLDFLTRQIEAQNQTAQNSLQQQALFVFETILNNNEISKALCSISENDSLTNITSYRAFKQHTQQFLNNKQFGLVVLRFISKNDTINSFDYSESIVPINQKTLNLDAQNPDTLHGISLIDHKLIYSFLFPFVLQNNFCGYVEIGFDVCNPKENYRTNPIFEHMIIASNKQNFNLLDSLEEFITTSEIDKFDLFHNFELPAPIKKELKHFFNEHLNQQGKETASWHTGYHKADSIFTLNKIPILLPNTFAFSANWNYDTMYKKAKELNNAIFIINIFIILTIMTGFTLTILNRFKIVKEKKEIQQSEAKLKEINQSKDRFFSIVAHDLKNPFNGIMGLSGYLMHDYDMVDDNERKEIISDINIASKNAFNLLQNLLEWTRAQTGTISNNPVMIDPRQIVALSLETVSNLAKNKEIEIVEDYLTDEKGYADENMITTVIRNLTTNAIKFSPRGKKIEITANTYENELYFQVKDYGIGINHNEIDQLFRIDVNFHKRGTEKETGTGLGLKLCKEFIENCGGKIWCVSEPGKGSSFYFTIPKYKG